MQRLLRAFLGNAILGSRIIFNGMGGMVTESRRGPFYFIFGGMIPRLRGVAFKIKSGAATDQNQPGKEYQRGNYFSTSDLHKCWFNNRTSVWHALPAIELHESSAGSKPQMRVYHGGFC